MPEDTSAAKLADGARCNQFVDTHSGVSDFIRDMYIQKTGQKSIAVI